MGIFNKFSRGQILSQSLLSILLLSACASPNAQAPTASTPTAASNASAASDTLRLLYWQAPTILNPHLAQGSKDFEASRITYEPLASFDKNGKLVPFLSAEIPSLENGGVAKDGKSVTWKLKQGVKWSDGKPFTAGDVVFTYQFVSDPAVGATTSANYQGVKSVEAVNDYTVKINFQEPNPAWSLPFVGSNGLILPRHIFEKYKGSNAREAPANLIPIGTGPYKVVDFKPGDIVVYEANSFFREANHFLRG